MRRAVRVGLVALGAAIAVYGVASLTGGWLGKPPWWERMETDQEWGDRLGVWDGPPLNYSPIPLPEPRAVPCPVREWISGGVIAAGLALVAIGAWPRRRRPAPQDAARPEHRGEA